MEQPTILSGEVHQDERGTLAYNNDFQMKDIKRFYTIEHGSEYINRAWQGHKKEQRWFQAVKGTFLILVVAPDDWENPSFNIKPKEYILTADKNQMIHIPGGYDTGIKALKPDSKLLVFSDFTIEESLADDYRFDSERWYYETFM